MCTFVRPEVVRPQHASGVSAVDRAVQLLAWVLYCPDRNGLENFFNDHRGEIDVTRVGVLLCKVT